MAQYPKRFILAGQSGNAGVIFRVQDKIFTIEVSSIGGPDTIG